MWRSKSGREDGEVVVVVLFGQTPQRKRIDPGHTALLRRMPYVGSTKKIYLQNLTRYGGSEAFCLTTHIKTPPCRSHQCYARVDRKKGFGSDLTQASPLVGGMACPICLGFFLEQKTVLPTVHLLTALGSIRS